MCVCFGSLGAGLPKNKTQNNLPVESDVQVVLSLPHQLAHMSRCNAYNRSFVLFVVSVCPSIPDMSYCNFNLEGKKSHTLASFWIFIIYFKLNNEF